MTKKAKKNGYKGPDSTRLLRPGRGRTPEIKNGELKALRPEKNVAVAVEILSRMRCILVAEIRAKVKLRNKTGMNAANVWRDRDHNKERAASADETCCVKQKAQSAMHSEYAEKIL